MSHAAKLFEYEGDQAFDLPDEFRFEGDEVYIRKDSATGCVILSQHPQPPNELTELADSLTC